MSPAPPPPPGPAIPDELLYVPTTTGQLLAVHTTNGSIAWMFNTSGPPGSENMLSPVAFVGGILYMTQTEHFRALDPVTGRELWSHKFSPIRVDTSQPAVGGGRAVITDANGVTYCYDTYNGTLLWKRTGILPAYWQFGRDQSSLPSIASDGNMYIRDFNGFLWAVNGSDGTTLWKTNQHYHYGFVSSTASFSEDESILYIVWSCYLLVALERATGKALWEVPLLSKELNCAAYSDEAYWATGPLVSTTPTEMTAITAVNFFLLNLTVNANNHTAQALLQKSFCTSETGNRPYQYFAKIHQTPVLDRNGALYFCALREMTALQANGSVRYYRHIALPDTSLLPCYGTVLDSVGRPYYIATQKVCCWCGRKSGALLPLLTLSLCFSSSCLTFVAMPSFAGHCTRPSDGRDAMDP
jgi:outer membrane protein assembly factor BamB